MKNEEKAREIAIKIEKSSSFLSGFGKKEIVVEELKNAAIEMAAWKEQQIIKWLKENACTFARINVNGQSVVSVDNMIISLKQAMEE